MGPERGSAGHTLGSHGWHGTTVRPLLASPWHGHCLCQATTVRVMYGHVVYSHAI